MAYFQKMLYASLVALAGCATSAELESLRAEVAKASAVAAQAQADAARAERQLATQKEAAESSEALSEPKPTSTAISADRAGYKWERIRDD